MIDFTKKSLALVKSDKILFSSDKSGLRPLIECIDKFKGKTKDCILYDKVIGLAAAKLIVYGGMITSVSTPLCSKRAKVFLKENSIPIIAENIVVNINSKDGNLICPMELKAQEFENNDLFYKELKEIFKMK